MCGNSALCTVLLARRIKLVGYYRPTSAAFWSISVSSSRLPNDVLQADPERAVLLSEGLQAIAVSSGDSLPQLRPVGPVAFPRELTPRIT